jgi:hypothetical protein
MKKITGASTFTADLYYTASEHYYTGAHVAVDPYCSTRLVHGRRRTTFFGRFSTNVRPRRVSAYILLFRFFVV